MKYRVGFFLNWNNLPGRQFGVPDVPSMISCLPGLQCDGKIDLGRMVCTDE